MQYWVPAVPSRSPDSMKEIKILFCANHQQIWLDGGGGGGGGTNRKSRMAAGDNCMIHYINYKHVYTCFNLINRHIYTYLLYILCIYLNEVYLSSRAKNAYNCIRFAS